MDANILHSAHRCAFARCSEAVSHYMLKGRLKMPLCADHALLLCSTDEEIVPAAHHRSGNVEALTAKAREMIAV